MKSEFSSVAAANPAVPKRWQLWVERLRAAPPATKGMLWCAAAGFLFCTLNALARQLTQNLAPLQAQFLRYFFGVAVLLPLVINAAVKSGWRSYWPKNLTGQFWRGGLHTAGLVLWFMALPRIPLADMTAIGFTGPIFIMIGARLFFGEPMHWDRWLATAIGMAGVLIVLGPKFSGQGGWWHLVMLGSAPLFAASFLLTKALTRQETAGVITFWQALTVTLLSLPLALPVWAAPSPWQWAGFALCGLLGSTGHYCITRGFAVADISATQSVKFLELVWSAALGLAIFGDVPTASTLLGGAVITAATVWLARREARRSSAVQSPDRLQGPASEH